MNALRYGAALALLLSACALNTEAPGTACAEVDVTKQLLKLDGSGTCKVPPYATIAQLYCTSTPHELTITASPDHCEVTVQHYCADVGPVWSFEMRQDTEDTMSGTLDVVGADCEWHGTLQTTIKH